VEVLMMASSRGYVALLFLAVALVYGWFLDNPLVFDDLQFFVPGSKAFPNLAAFDPLQIRWLPYASLAWSYDLSGGSTVWLRIEALLLHAAVGGALFYLIVELYRQVPGSNEPNGQFVTRLAFCSALLFVLHPVAAYGAGYLVQRTIVMATLFSLWALVAYLRGLATGKAGWLWLSAFLYLMAVLSKEHAIMLPMLMLALTALMGRTIKAMRGSLLAVYGACLVIALFVLAQKYGILGATYEDSATEMLQEIQVEHAYPLSILTQCWLFFKYLGLWLLPNPAWMSIDMREPFAPPAVLSPYLVAGIAFAGYGVLAIRLLFKDGAAGLLGFGMLFPWLLFFTEFGTVRIQEPFVLYRSYLWMPGLFIAVPLVLARMGQYRVKWPMVFLVFLLTLFSIDRLTTFSQRFLLWDDAAKLLRDKPHILGAERIYANRAKGLRELGRHNDALLDYRHAIALRPGFADYHHGMAVVLLEMRDFAQALDEFGMAIELDPQHKLAYYGRGMLYWHLGHKAEAGRDLSASCNLGWQAACLKRKDTGS
jgi:hypothetical protein